MFLLGDLDVCGSGGGCGVFKFASESMHFFSHQEPWGRGFYSYLAVLIRLLLGDSHLKLSGRVHLFSPISTMHEGKGSELGHVPFQGESSVSILGENCF